jgi:hypothetical protein
VLVDKTFCSRFRGTYLTRYLGYMSTTTRTGHGVIGDVQSTAVTEKKGESGNYKGFVAGVFSGVAKLSGK